MTTDWNWAGARWWKFDLHSHTPASDDYGRGSNQAQLKQKNPREWLMDFIHAGIDCVVVSDHNSGEWIDLLKAELKKMESEKLEGFHPLYLFPAVEIGIQGGVHLLAVFGFEFSTAQVNQLLGAAGFNGSLGCKDALTSKSLAEVAQEITRCGGVAIPAHADRENGIFHYTGDTLDQVLKCPDIFSMEIVDSNFQKPQQYFEKKITWTEVFGSDSHHPHTIGKNFTWIKMSQPNLDGLRLALLDGPLSVKKSDSFSGDPNHHGHLSIESILIDKARYIGRSRTFDCKFNPWLNTIIGGRGTGKSTLLEFLRITLRREDELKEMPESLRGDFEKYRDVYATRNDEGLLTEDSKFCVIYRKDDAVFRIQWSYDGKETAIQEKQEDGSFVPVFGEVRQRFPVRMYSQKQIFEMARRPQALLKIIDDAPEVNYREWSEKWNEEEKRFLALKAKSREFEAGLQEESRLLGEIDDVKRKLIIFEKAQYSQILKTYQKRLRQLRAVESWEKSWNKPGFLIRELAEQLVPENMDDGLFDNTHETDKQFFTKIETVSKALEQIVIKLNSISAEADNIVTEWNKSKSESLWQESVNEAMMSYTNLRDQLQKEKAGDPQEYGKLVQDRQTLEERLKNLSSRRKSLKDIDKQGEESLEKLKSLRQELTQRRSRFLKSVLSTNPYVFISVLPYGSKDTVEEDFRSVLQIGEGRYEKDVGKVGGGGILGDLYAFCPKNRSDENRFHEEIKNFEKKLKKEKTRIKKTANGENLDQDLKDKRFATFLGNLPPENFDRLDYWFPEDSLDVLYSTKPGADFRPVQQGSPGQKTAALLAFLLSYGNEPLVLDQPEDDLDNQLIYDLIVNQLRTIKQARQVIVVTHNANIVVNGDSELVLALDVGNGETQKVSEGSLQESSVREEICNIMEGGKEAFDQRYRRIKAGGKYV